MLVPALTLSPLYESRDAARQQWNVIDRDQNTNKGV